MVKAAAGTENMKIKQGHHCNGCCGTLDEVLLAVSALASPTSSAGIRKRGVYPIKWLQSELYLLTAAPAQLCHISRCSVLMEYFSHRLFEDPPPTHAHTPFFPSFHLLQTNQYGHSLAFHRKDYREMAIKGLASITSTISQPLKDSGSCGSRSRTRCPVTLQGYRQNLRRVF